MSESNAERSGLSREANDGENITNQMYEWASTITNARRGGCKQIAREGGQINVVISLQVNVVIDYPSFPSLACLVHFHQLNWALD